MSDNEQLSVGGIPITSPSGGADQFVPMTLLLWGISGCGKTTLAATAPGANKLWLQFDPQGTSSIANIPGIHVLDFSGAGDDVTKKFRDDDPIGIDRFLKDHPEMETVVVDSLTTFGDKALAYGVRDAAGTAQHKGATIEDPGFGGHGRKNTWMRYLVKNMLRICAKHKRHCIFIAHEDAPDRDKEGKIERVTILIGSNLVSLVPVNINEVWMLYETEFREHRIAIRPIRVYRPMKTRMFMTGQGHEYEFTWKYNPNTGEGMTLAALYEQWRANGYRKIPVPASK